MAEIPELKLTEDALSHWYAMALELKKLKAREILLRKALFNLAFPDPKEGTNKYELEGGYMLNGQYTLERSIDEGALNALKPAFAEKEISVDKLVKWKPSLAKAEYNKLSDENKKFFDQCIVIKPGSPSMTVVMPAKNKPVAGETG